MPADPPPSSSARIVLSLPQGPLRDQLVELLEARDADVNALPPSGDDLGQQIERLDADLVIVRRMDLGDDELDAIAAADDAPDVLVVGTGLDSHERVDLVASGAAEALDTAVLDATAAGTIEAIAQGGGHATPDTGTGRPPALTDFASRNKRMQGLLELVGRIADSDSTVLVSGETGVGKEHLARAIHAASGRATGPFVAVNCGALPETLLESELFGHAAGAFTGAAGSRKGVFEMADGGTLFLDEIGDMPTHLQVKLLTALERGEIRRLGDETVRRVDVRVMSATNRDLRKESAAGTFREDLFYRLNMVELPLPPLRERREDLPGLIGAFLRHVRRRLDRFDVEGLDEHALDLLLGHDWPGNVRELIHVLERAVLVCRTPRIGSRDLPPAIAGREAPAATDFLAGLPEDLLAAPWKVVREDVVRRTERTYLDALLRATGGAVGETAERAGLSPRSLYDKMKRHGLRKEDYR